MNNEAQELIDELDIKQKRNIKITKVLITFLFFILLSSIFLTNKFIGIFIQHG